MQEDIRDRIVEDLLSIPPIILRAVRNKLIKTTIPEIDISLTPNHFEILKLLEDEGTLHVAEIGKRLQIAKAQMTQLIDKLVALKMVEKKLDAADRRYFKISLTRKARKLLQEHKTNITRAVKEIMSGLSDKEMENLSVSLRNLRDILSGEYTRQ